MRVYNRRILSLSKAVVADINPRGALLFLCTPVVLWGEKPSRLLWKTLVTLHLLFFNVEFERIDRGDFKDSR